MSENFLQTINKTNKTNSQLRSPKQASHLGHTTAETPGAATMAAAADVRMPHHADVCVRTRRRLRQDAPSGLRNPDESSGALRSEETRAWNHGSGKVFQVHTHKLYVCISLSVCVYIWYMDICKWMYDETNYAICYILIKGRI